MIEITTATYRETIYDKDGIKHTITMQVDFDKKTYRIDCEEYGVHLKQDKLEFCGHVFCAIIGLRSKAEELLK